MKRLLAGVVAAGMVAAAGGLSTGTAAAVPPPPPAPPVPEPSPAPSSGVGADVVYALGGARAPGIPWFDYTMRAGSLYYPDTARELVDYPAGAPFSWVPEMFLPPGGRDTESIGQAAIIATDSLEAAIRQGRTPAAAVGLSQGTLALDNVQVRLAGDPTAPPPDALEFTTIGDPTGTHGFGASFLAGVFQPGSYIPFIDYTMPEVVESQYDANRVIATYDGLADFPDRPDNLLAVVNATAGSAIVHTPAAFTGPGDVPPQNIRTEVNSLGATTTTYLIPVNSLPLTLPLRYLGLSAGFVDQVDAVLQPQIDAGYSRYDDPLNRPVAVDPINGMDPIAVLDPQTRGTIENTFAPIRDLIAPFAP